MPHYYFLRIALHRSQATSSGTSVVALSKDATPQAESFWFFRKWILSGGTSGRGISFLISGIVV